MLAISWWYFVVALVAMALLAMGEGDSSSTGSTDRTDILSNSSAETNLTVSNGVRSKRQSYYGMIDREYDEFDSRRCTIKMER